MSYLADVNVWIALAAEQHVHHLAMVPEYRGGESCVLPRYTNGLSAALDEQACDAREHHESKTSMEIYRVLRADRRIGYLAEPVEFPELWHSYFANFASRVISPNVWTDAYLCAFAHVARLTLVTFDAKIAKREGVSCLVLGQDS